MSAERFIANMLRIASEDLQGARLLSAAKNRNAIYLCEQAAEKIIRVVLTSENVNAGIRHDLFEMVRQVPDANPLKPLLREIAGLAPYATTFRYAKPAGGIPGAPSQREFDEFASKVDEALTRTTKAFGVDLTDDNSSSRSIAPVR